MRLRCRSRKCRRRFGEDGYTWDYGGKGDRTVCPMCGTTILVHRRNNHTKEVKQ